MKKHTAQTIIEYVLELATSEHGYKSITDIIEYIADITERRDKEIENFLGVLQKIGNLEQNLFDILEKFDKLKEKITILLCMENGQEKDIAFRDLFRDEIFCGYDLTLWQINSLECTRI